MVIVSNPRRFSPLMAQSSFKLKIVGTAARALNASKSCCCSYVKNITNCDIVPVIRPQDLATKGSGKLVVNKDSNFILNGIETQFTQETGPRDLIVLHKTLKFEVAEVISDTELKLKTELNLEALEFISNDAAYKIIPHIDQSVLYEKVHERLDKGESIVIFPEGGSHDRSEMLPLKGRVLMKKKKKKART